MAITENLGGTFFGGVDDIKRGLTQTVEESVNSSKYHRLQLAIQANKEKLDKLRSEYTYDFGEKRTRGQDQAVEDAIKNFQQAYDALVAIDRRTVVFTGAFLLSGILAPFITAWITWPLSTIGNAGTFLSLGERKVHSTNYYNARQNLKLALGWMVSEVSEDDLHLAPDEDAVLRATELLLPVMKERDSSRRDAPGTLDALIDNRVEAAVLNGVRLRMDVNAKANDPEADTWTDKYFKKEQATMHFMLYGDGRGSPLDFAKGIWFFIYNLVASGVNWVKGEEQMKASTAYDGEVPNLSPSR